MLKEGMFGHSPAYCWKLIQSVTSNNALCNYFTVFSKHFIFK